MSGKNSQGFGMQISKKSVQVAIIGVNYALIMVTLLLTIASLANGVEAGKQGQTVLSVLYAVLFIASALLLKSRCLKVHRDLSELL